MKCDTNDVGSVSIDGIVDLLERMGLVEATDRSSLVDLFAAADTDGDGCISFDDFKKSFSSMMAMSSAGQPTEEEAPSSVDRSTNSEYFQTPAPHPQEDFEDSPMITVNGTPADDAVWSEDNLDMENEVQLPEHVKLRIAQNDRLGRVHFGTRT